jgi:hypothetical protein
MRGGVTWAINVIGSCVGIQSALRSETHYAPCLQAPSTEMSLHFGADFSELTIRVTEGCEPYAPAALPPTPRKIPGTHFR